MLRSQWGLHHNLPPAQVILRFLHRAEHRSNAFDLSPPQSYGLLIRIKIRHAVAALLVAASYFGFAQYFMPYPRPDTRIMLVQRDDSDDWIQIALSMDEQMMMLIHTGIGLAIIVITALIAWHAPGPKWFVPWAQDSSNRALHRFSPDGLLGTKFRAKPLRQAQGVPEGHWGVTRFLGEEFWENNLHIVLTHTIASCPEI